MSVKKAQKLNQNIVCVIVDDLLALAAQQALLDEFAKQLGKYVALLLQGPIET